MQCAAPSGTPGDIDDVQGGPQGQVRSWINGLSFVALTPQGQYPHFIFNVDKFSFSCTKTVGLLQKVMFLPFLPNFEALPPPADRSNRETDENNELAAV